MRPKVSNMVPDATPSQVATADNVGPLRTKLQGSSAAAAAHHFRRFPPTSAPRQRMPADNWFSTPHPRPSTPANNCYPTSDSWTGVWSHLRKVVGADALVPVAGPDAGAPLSADQRLLPLALRLQQPCTQHPQRLGPIPVRGTRAHVQGVSQVSNPKPLTQACMAGM